MNEKENNNIIDSKHIEEQNTLLITKALNTIQSDAKHIIFPIEEKHTLTPQDISSFLTKLHSHISKREEKPTCLTLMPCDITAIEGLLHFLNEEKGTLCFNEIVLEIPESLSDHSEAFNKSLNALFKSLSLTPVKTITISDPKHYLTTEDWEKTTDIICDGSLYLFEIILSKDKQEEESKKITNELQRNIDKAIDTNHWMHRGIKNPTHQKDEKGSLNEEEITALESPDALIDCSNIDNTYDNSNDVGIDINFELELEQEQQYEQASKPIKLRIDNDKDNAPKIEQDHVILASQEDKFYELLLQLQLGSNPEAYLVSEEEARELWNTWFGHFIDIKTGKKNENQALGGITLEACEQLLIHKNQFKMGFADPLPKGFKIVNASPMALDYNEESYNKTPSPQALVLKNKPQWPILNIILCDTLIEQLKDKEGYKTLIDIWNSYTKKEYDREEFQLIRKHFIQLVSLTDGQMKRLFVLTQEKDKPLNAKQFDFLLNHAFDIAALLEEKYELSNQSIYGRDEPLHPTAQYILQLMGNDKKRAEQFIQLAIELSKNTPKEPHPIEILLKGNNKAISCIKDESKPYNKDALLYLYHNKGEQAVLGVLFPQESNKLEPFPDYLYQKSQVCLDAYDRYLDPDYQTALKQIKKVNKPTTEEKEWWEWWDLLLERHLASNEYVCLPTIVHAFFAFKEQVNNHKLTFYALNKETSFKDVTNMQTALTRIISIIGCCRMRDRNSQWRFVHELNLQSSGALRAFTDSKQPKASYRSFVFPGQEHIRDFKNVTDDNKNYLDDYGWKKIATTPVTGNKENDRETLRHKRRLFLSHQEHRYSLDFYTDALGLFNKEKYKGLSPEVIHGLTGLLLATTSGSFNQSACANEDEALKHWQAILDSLIALPGESLSLDIFGVGKKVATTIRYYIIQLLIQSPIIPPLPIFKQLFVLSRASVENIGKTALSTDFKKAFIFGNTLRDLISSGASYEDALYKGMRFFDANDYNGKTFDAYLETIATMNDKIVDWIGDLDVKQDLLHEFIPLISTFQLKSENFQTNVLTPLKTLKERTGIESPSLFAHLTKLLAAVNTNKNEVGEKLTAEDLKSLIEDVTPNKGSEEYSTLASSWDKSEYLKGKIRKVLETKPWKKYYSEQFFERLDGPKTPEEVTTWVEKEFLNYPIEIEGRSKEPTSEQGLIKEMLKKITLYNPEEHYKRLVQKIAEICNTLSKIERTEFLVSLTGKHVFSYGLYSWKDIEGILDAIMERGNINDFMYLIHQANTVNIGMSMVKAYLDTFLPQLEKQYGSKHKKDSLPIIAQLVARDTALPNSVDADRVSFDDMISIVSVRESCKRMIDAIEIMRTKDDSFFALIVDKTSVSWKMAYDSIGPIKQSHPQFFCTVTEEMEELENLCGLTQDSEKKKQEEGTEKKLYIDKQAKLLLEKIYAGVYKELKTTINAKCSFTTMLHDTMTTLYALVEQYPECKKGLYGLVQKHMQYNLKDSSLMFRTFAFVTQLHQELSHLNDPDIVLSFCYHFTDSGSLTLYDMNHYIFIDEFKLLNNTNKKLVLQVITRLLDNKNFSFDTRELIQKCLLSQQAHEPGKENKNHDSFLFLNVLEEQYKTPPYPFMNRFIDWYETARKAKGEALDDKFKKLDKNALIDRIKYHDKKDLEQHTEHELLDMFAFQHALEQKQKQHDLRPCSREIGEQEGDKTGNGFHIKLAVEKIKEFKEVPWIDALKKLTQEELKARAYNTHKKTVVDKLTQTELLDIVITQKLKPLEKETHDARQLSTKQLVAILKLFKYKNMDVDALKKELKLTEKQQEEFQKTLTNEKLLAVAAELLYRINGWSGTSSELNTTQYLSLFNALEASGPTFSSMGTGQGKSNFFAIWNACQFAKGYTSDFITDNELLALRDYLSYKEYYKCIGAVPSLITANSRAEDYKKKGINCTDPRSRQLFLINATVTGNSSHVLDEKPEMRSLSVDEADKLLYNHRVRFNYSIQASKSMQNKEWVYPLLVEFLQQEHTDKNNKKALLKNVYQSNKHLYPKMFRHYALTHGATKEQLAEVTDQQLKIWLKSAVTAMRLEYKKDFDIDSNAIATKSTGLISTSMAILKINHQPDRNSKYSEGAHQCLHAYLNWLKNNPDANKDVHLKHKLSSLKRSFHIDTEKQIVYTTTPTVFLNDYKKGRSLIASGTVGSLTQRYEATTKSGLGFIFSPRHQKSKRIDKPIRMTRDETSQFEALMEYVLEAQEKKQPVLIFCENDIKSKELYDKIIKRLNELDKAKTPSDKKEKDKTNIQLVDSEHGHKEKAISKAGHRHMITVTTEMLGRGIDFKVVTLKENDAQDYGMAGFITYMPEDESELIQLMGRIARYDNPGSLQLIVNKEQLKIRYGKTTLTDGFYTNPEHYIKAQFRIMEFKEQQQRMIAKSKDMFINELTVHFDTAVRQNKLFSSRHDDINQLWKVFLKDTNTTWQIQWQTITQILKNQKDTEEKIELINDCLDVYRASVKKHWALLRTAIAKDNNPLIEESIIKALTLDGRTTELMRGFDVNQLMDKITPIYKKYDKAHAGRAVVYACFYEEFWATWITRERSVFENFWAWWDGHGILFPNLRALLRQDMSLKQYLFGGASNFWEFVGFPGEVVDPLEQMLSEGIPKYEAPKVSKGVKKTLDLGNEKEPIYEQIFKTNNENSDLDTDKENTEEVIKLSKN
jgi:hypothetical protein